MLNENVTNDSYVISQIRFRCPHCQKLYFTENTVFSISKNLKFSNSVEFQCSECTKDFLLVNQAENTGLYKTESNIKSSFQECPKCFKLKLKEQDECPQCGVYESQFMLLSKVENPRLFQLNRLWDVVITDLMNDSYHQKFIDHAQRDSALNYAAQKYNDLKKIMGPDPLIEKYIQQIEIRLENQIQTQLKSEENSTKKTLAKYEMFQRVFILVAVFGTVLLLINKASPMFPNLNGIIVSITVMSYGLWFFSKTS